MDFDQQRSLTETLLEWLAPNVMLLVTDIFKIHLLFVIHLTTYFTT